MVVRGPGMGQRSGNVMDQIKRKEMKTKESYSQVRGSRSKNIPTVVPWCAVVCRAPVEGRSNGPCALSPTPYQTGIAC